MKITIIGCGYVGTVTGVCFADMGHDVFFYDIDPQKPDSLAKGVSPIYEKDIETLIQTNKGRIHASHDLAGLIQKTDIAFVCVGTPSHPDGAINTDYILSACRAIGGSLQRRETFYPVIIKSTVFPGTTQGEIKNELENSSGKKASIDFGLGSNPEFLREGNAVYDFKNPDRIVFGTGDEKTLQCLRGLYASFTCPKIETSIKTAEMIKYASNAFLATKISFANEIGNLSKKLGIDAREVFEGVGLDHRIGSEFFRTGIGFGGSCFPKDLRALIAGAARYDEGLNIVRKTLEVNEEQPFHLIALLKKHLPDLSGKRIGVLGLAFKPDTDDIRESRAIPVIRELKNQGADIIAFDPMAMDAFRAVFPNISYASSIQEVLSADAVLIVTEWREFESVSYEGKIVIDGRGNISAERSAAVYEGVCW